MKTNYFLRSACALMLLTVSFFSFQAKAEAVVIGSIAYNLDGAASTAETAQLPTDDAIVPYVGDLVIPATVEYQGKTYAVKKIGDNSLRNSNITSLTVAEGIEVVGNSSLAQNESLVTVVLPSTVKEIQDWAFYGCYALATINIPDGVPAITEHTFQECKALTSITLPASVTSLKVCAFQDASNLASINLENITEIIDWSLYGTAITSAHIQNVGIIHTCAFAKCPNLETVTIEGAYTIVDWVFQDCPKLTSVSLGEGLEDIGTGAFSGCSSLTSLTLPNSIFYIGGWALEKTALSSVYVSWEDPEEIVINDDAFGQDDNKPGFTWYVPSDLKDIYGDEWLGFPVAVTGTDIAVVTNSSVTIINRAKAIEVKADAGVTGSVSVYTIAGVQVYSKAGQINGTKVELPTGLYIVKVTSNEGVTTSKVIVK